MRNGSLILAAVVFGSSTLWAQHRVTPPSTIFIPVDQTPTPNYQYHDGTATLIDGTVLQGLFRYNGRNTFVYRTGGQALSKRIGFSMIRRLAVAGADSTTTTRSDSTIFVRLGRRLYRQLTGGTTMVVDRRFSVDEERGRIGQRLYVLDDNGDFHRFSSLQKLNKWFYAFRERSGKSLPDVFLNENEIVKAVARINGE
ncbi:hypothetical protein [Spirosoma oryzicola]|uniref:hypothetical protein n=1 Tax=Spirosoma oryzicola TaxID=2898794 RepID=UPI001E5BF532|nr:hypothetical protein [Spirosoma oryzicola]UHG89111.1 hypothetical protein LQ777_12735 [Spirosoma oryzicola]